ncbi:KR domain-containing protein [Colletotrichum tofieldiae]|nr:KR domain-containing protein [Colletotrichum tofieldiae]GKT68975.1 KR domain-containing protein [Colletotrichum tofieldiae]GKT96838.1 KR domain-containing protein [Colletotrichum tofieldiae]
MTRQRSSSSPPASSGKYVNPAEIAVGLGSTKALRDPSNRVPWRRDIRMAVAHVKGLACSAQAGPESRGLAQFLGGLDADPSALGASESLDFLTIHIGEAICGLMMKNRDELNVDVPLAAFGVDSLVAIEIRDWCHRTFGVHVKRTRDLEC